MAAFEHVRGLSEVYDHLTANELRPGFVFDGERIPLVNPQRGIFKPRKIRFLLSIKTVFPSRAPRFATTINAKFIAKFSRVTKQSITLSWGRTRMPPTTDGFGKRSRTKSRSSISSAPDQTALCPAPAGLFLLPIAHNHCSCYL